MLNDRNANILTCRSVTIRLSDRRTGATRNCAAVDNQITGPHFDTAYTLNSAVLNGQCADLRMVDAYVICGGQHGTGLYSDFGLCTTSCAIAGNSRLFCSHCAAHNQSQRRV